MDTVVAEVDIPPPWAARVNRGSPAFQIYETADYRSPHCVAGRTRISASLRMLPGTIIPALGFKDCRRSIRLRITSVAVPARTLGGVHDLETRPAEDALHPPSPFVSIGLASSSMAD